MSSDIEGQEFEYEQSGIALIAKPFASSKLHRRVFKLVRKSAKDKSLKRGVREVVKSIRKNVKGIVVLAGDVSPIDVLTHIPVLCEEAKIPYVYVGSKAALGAAGTTKRPTCCILVPEPKKASDLAKYYEKCLKEIKPLSD